MEVLGQLVQGIRYQLARDRLNLSHTSRGLHCKGGYTAHAIAAVSSQSLNIGRYACTRGWIVTGDAEYNRLGIGHFFQSNATPPKFKHKIEPGFCSLLQNNPFGIKIFRFLRLKPPSYVMISRFCPLRNSSLSAASNVLIPCKSL